MTVHDLPTPEVLSRREAERRILSALMRAEHAQRELYEACSELASINGFVREWEATGKVADRVKALWHKVNGAFLGGRGTWELDEGSLAAFIKRQEER